MEENIIKTTFPFASEVFALQFLRQGGITANLESLSIP